MNSPAPAPSRRPGILAGLFAVLVKSTNKEFEANAVDAVAKWKFKAGWKNNHAVFRHMQVPIEFTLEKAN